MEIYLLAWAGKHFQNKYKSQRKRMINLRILKLGNPAN